jgi:tetratricopeptide (TPR) repeat protein
VSEKDGAVTAVVTDAKNACSFPKGTVVLDGSRLDDSVVGTLKACKVGDGCSGAVDGAAMLLISKSGTVISGAVHLEIGACKTPLGGDSVLFRKGAGKAAPAVKTDKTPPRVRAEKVVADAYLAYQADGNAEAFRTKCQEALQIDPTYAEAAVGIGVTFNARQRYDEALEWYKKALELNPAVSDAYYNIACVYAQAGDSEQALRYLHIALLNGYVSLQTLATDPELKSLEGIERFEKLKQAQTD